MLVKNANLSPIYANFVIEISNNTQKQQLTLTDQAY